eukprot:1160576-Pelagomonas_calceolata.AAC.1
MQPDSAADSYATRGVHLLLLYVSREKYIYMPTAMQPDNAADSYATRGVHLLLLFLLYEHVRAIATSGTPEEAALFPNETDNPSLRQPFGTRKFHGLKVKVLAIAPWPQAQANRLHRHAGCLLAQAH